MNFSEFIIEDLFLTKKIKSSVFFGEKNEKCHGISDYELLIPSCNVAKFQESYMMICHYFFSKVEDRLIKKWLLNQFSQLQKNYD